jgi:hypothetical protein
MLAVTALAGFGAGSAPGEVATAQPANTVFHCHWDGTDAATTATDVGPTAHTITFAGNAQIDTAQSKFGTGSLLLDGTGDTCSCADHANFEFGSSDFTAEAWVRFAAVSGTHVIMGKFTGAGDQRSWRLDYEHSNTTLALTLSADGAATVVIDETWAPVIDTWYHVAASRTGGNVYLFVDGVKLGTETANSTNVFGGTAAFYVGSTNAGASGFFNGWIDETLVIKGTGLYSANFTPHGLAYTDDP